MAKSKLQFKRNTTDKLSVKGTLSETCDSIVYLDENEAAQEVNISDLLNAFSGQDIDLSISLKTDEDLDLV